MLALPTSRCHDPPPHHPSPHKHPTSQIPRPTDNSPHASQLAQSHPLNAPSFEKTGSLGEGTLFTPLHPPTPLIAARSGSWGSRWPLSPTGGGELHRPNESRGEPFRLLLRTPSHQFSFRSNEEHLHSACAPRSQVQLGAGRAAEGALQKPLGCLKGPERAPTRIEGDPLKDIQFHVKPPQKLDVIDLLVTRVQRKRGKRKFAHVYW